MAMTYNLLLAPALMVDPAPGWKKVEFLPSEDPAGCGSRAELGKERGGTSQGRVRNRVSLDIFMAYYNCFSRAPTLDSCMPT